MAQSTTEADEVIVFDCDLKLGDYILNSVFNFKQHRRIEHYGPITSQTGAEDYVHPSSKRKLLLCVFFSFCRVLAIFFGSRLQKENAANWYLISFCTQFIWTILQFLTAVPILMS